MFNSIEHKIKISMYKNSNNSLEKISNIDLGNVCIYSWVFLYIKYSKTDNIVLLSQYLHLSLCHSCMTPKVHRRVLLILLHSYHIVSSWYVRPLTVVLTKHTHSLTPQSTTEWLISASEPVLPVCRPNSLHKHTLTLPHPLQPARFRLFVPVNHLVITEPRPPLYKALRPPASSLFYSLEERLFKVFPSF